MSVVSNIGRHDPAQRRKSLRNGRERGCWVYIPAEELSRAGIDVSGNSPWYRTWGYRRGPRSASVIVALYREP